MGARKQEPRFVGTNVLAGLCHVSKVCFLGIRTVAINKFGNKAWP